MRASGGTAAVHAHLPGRAVAGERVLLILGDVVGAHPGEEIVRMVVFAHVVEAEAPVLVLAIAPLRRTMGRGPTAARPLAGRMRGAQPPVEVRLDPDAVEEWRVGRHDRSLWGLRRYTFKS